MEKEVVVVNGISKKYGKDYAVKNLSFKIKENTIFGLLGSNGAGKSTTLHMLIGLLSNDGGELQIFGERVLRKYSKNLKKKVAIVPQEISLYRDLSIFDNLYFFGRAYGLNKKIVLDKIKELQGIFQLGDMKRPVKNLSGGYQRRVSFAVALIGNPDLIILDEALVGIDIETKKMITDLLLELKKTKTIIITTHSIDDAERLCDDILLLHQGSSRLYGNTRALIKEYEDKRSKILEITFKDKNKLNDFVKNFHKKFSFMPLVEDLSASIPFSKNFLINSKFYNFASILNFTDFYKDHIFDIEVKKPGLNELMMEAIKR